MSRPTQGSNEALRIRGCHPLRPAFPDRSASPRPTTGLLRFRSPLLTESRLMSSPPGTEMFQFPGFASPPYEFRRRYPKRGGLPHSDIHGSTLARSSPWLFAACHVLHRLLTPRHPPNALASLKKPNPGITPGPPPCIIPPRNDHDGHAPRMTPKRKPRPPAPDHPKNTTNPSSHLKEQTLPLPPPMVEVIGLEPTTPCLQSRRSPS